MTIAGPISPSQASASAASRPKRVRLRRASSICDKLPGPVNGKLRPFTRLLRRFPLFFGCSATATDGEARHSSGGGALSTRRHLRLQCVGHRPRRTMEAAARAAAHEALRLARAGRVDEALKFAERAVDGAQQCLPAHGLLASLLLRLGRPDDAERIVAQAVELAPGGADAYDGLANVSMALGQHDRANALYRRATQLAPNDPRFWYNLACSERSLGRLIEAEAACDRGIALDPSQYPTFLLRSELRVQHSSANHIEELQAQLTRAGGDYRALIFLGYALAKELDDVGRFDEAFRWFATAAKARRSRLVYDVATDEGKLLRIAEVYTRDFVAQTRAARTESHA